MLVATLASGCDTEPLFVYVLEAPQAVELAISTSADKVRVDQPFVLKAERRTRGRWKRIAMRQRSPESCYMRRVPPEFEPEVADNLRWHVSPEGAARFNIDNRPDHTRLVVISRPGQYTLTASTSVWCERNRSVMAPAIQIEVIAR